GDELDEVVDLEGGASGVLDLPDSHGGDLDGTAGGVIDLHHGGLVVADACGDLGAHGERVDPVQAFGAHGAHVTSEELDDAGLVGGDHRQPGEEEAPHQGDRETDPDEEFGQADGGREGDDGTEQGDGQGHQEHGDTAC